MYTTYNSSSSEDCFFLIANSYIVYQNQTQTD